MSTVGWLGGEDHGFPSHLPRQTMRRIETSPLQTTMAARVNVRVACPTNRTVRDGSLRSMERELYAHCAKLEGGEGSQTCWVAYEELERRKKSAETVQERSDARENAEELDHLEQLARECLGMPSKMMRTLHALANCRRGKSVDVTEANWDLLERRMKAERVFHRLDRDGNGVLDPAEFRHGMHLLDEDLDGGQVEMVFRALETNGFVTLDEFRMIAETTDDLSHESRHTHALRHLHLRPGWWTDPTVA
mmetsp:Transcript_4473/g.15945  ORF Transcript_4473/g.15945 Transcript_4473/m.15945 type:complete len:249 (-) Transcript_4473:192-938(-)